MPMFGRELRRRRIVGTNEQQRAVNIRPDIVAVGNVPIGRDSFANFLLEHSPLPAPTIAAPGLSPHGQMRAVDFHVESDGSTVAGPDTQTIESIWLAAGWRDKLSAAVIASGAEFVGPLEKPDEPWHYSYSGVLEPGTTP